MLWHVLAHLPFFIKKEIVGNKKFRRCKICSRLNSFFHSKKILKQLFNFLSSFFYHLLLSSFKALLPFHWTISSDTKIMVIEQKKEDLWKHKECKKNCARNDEPIEVINIFVECTSCHIAHFSSHSYVRTVNFFSYHNKQIKYGVDT